MNKGDTFGSGFRHTVATLRFHTIGRYYRRVLRGELHRSEIELRLLPSLLQPGDVFVDVGANFGPYSYVAASIGAQVEVFEPQPNLARRLATTFAPRARVHAVALSDRTGQARLSIPVVQDKVVHTRASLVEGEAVDAQHFEAELSTLDHYNLSPSLVKIDVEGHEVPVLFGAAETIERNRPTVIIEVEDTRTPGALKSVRDFFVSRDYVGFFVTPDDQIRPYDDFDPVRFQSRNSLPEPGKRKSDVYINNFVWIHPGSNTFPKLCTRDRLIELTS